MYRKNIPKRTNSLMQSHDMRGNRLPASNSYIENPIQRYGLDDITAMVGDIHPTTPYKNIEGKSPTGLQASQSSHNGIVDLKSLNKFKIRSNSQN